MPSHRADTPALRRPRDNRRAASARRTGPRGASARNGRQLSAPQVGIAGALGLATIAAPISGAMASPAPKAEVNPISAVAFAPAPAFPAREVQQAVGVEALRVIPAGPLQARTPELLAAPRTVYVARASRARERPVLPGCDGIPKVTNAPNGQLPRSVLCTLWESDHSLRADAAVALAKLNIAYKQRFGENICLTDSYRTLDSQRRLKSLKPGLAAQPGTSEHGWGLAVDLCDGVEKGSSSVRYQWMRENAPDYGWDNPEWARPGGSMPEAWHWEYIPGTGG